MRERNTVDEYVDRMERLFQRRQRIESEIDRAEVMLYRGNLSAEEFAKVAAKRRNLLIEQEVIENEIKRKYGNGSND
mgnify:CR=1 FL=1